MSANPLGVVQTARRTWNIEEYEEKAKERASNSSSQPRRAPPVMREAAPVRDKALDLDSQVGRVTVVQTTAGSRSDVGAFFCDICDCTLRDNIAYLDHINGRKHLRMMGFSARTEKVTVADVRAKLASLKRKRDEISNYDLDARVKQLQEEEAAARRERRESKKAKTSTDEEGAARPKEKPGHDDQEVIVEAVDPELAAMGLPTSFGSSK